MKPNINHRGLFACIGIGCLTAGVFLACIWAFADDAEILEKKGARVERNLVGQIIALDLSHCDVRDGDVDCLASLSHLRQLDLSATPITDTAILSVAKAEQLESLSLENTVITDKGVTMLKRLHLRRLNLNSTAISDVALRDVAQITTLNYLSCLDTRITDEGLAELSALPRLMSLGIAGCKISPDAIADLKRNSPSLTTVAVP